MHNVPYVHLRLDLILELCETFLNGYAIDCKILVGFVIDWLYFVLLLFFFQWENQVIEAVHGHGPDSL